MKSMIAVQNPRYVAFFELGDNEKAKQLRKTDPRLKYARITEILQGCRTVIEVGIVYKRHR